MKRAKIIALLILSVLACTFCLHGVQTVRREAEGQKGERVFLVKGINVADKQVCFRYVGNDPSGRFALLLPATPVELAVQLDQGQRHLEPGAWLTCRVRERPARADGLREIELVCQE